MVNEKKKIIIRDDDTSFFARPALLERLYGRLWERGIPVCLSVIPAQHANVHVEYRPGSPLDPSVPPQYRGVDKEHPITDNREICAYLNEKARQGLVEICLHGFSHSYMEFMSTDTALIERKLVEGKRILQTAFPDASINTFIAPYDYISKPAWDVILESGFDICTNTQNFVAMPALSHLESYQGIRLASGRKIFTCNEFLFTHRDDPAESVAKARSRMQTESILVISNHYWCFYFDWEEAANPLQAQWDVFVDDLLALPEGQVTTFARHDDLPSHIAV